MLGSPELGSFVTIDAVLHGLRVTTEEGYREMERSHMAPNLESVLKDLSKSLSSQLASERNQQLSAALARLLAYVQTAHLLVDPTAPIDPRVADAVQAELRNISETKSVAPSAIFPDRKIDYARFSPEGRYTLDPTLRGYYQARTWLGAISFEIRPSSSERDLAEMRMATLLARTMDILSGQSDFKTRYLAIYEPLGFFSGRPDHDVTWDMLAGGLRGYYGQAIMGSASQLGDNSGLAEFAPYLQKQLPTAGGGSRGFRFLGESSTGGLIGEKIDASGKGTALAFMAALGNDRAAQLAGGSTKASILSSRPAEEWVQSLNSTILYTVAPLLDPADRGDGYPRFMRSNAWHDRELASAMGAWTNYRGTLLMQQMQSSPRVATSSGEGDLESSGYVEPNPEAWSRLASLAGYLRSGFTNGPEGRMISKKVEEKLRDIEAASLQMMKIAAQELDGRALTSEQNDLVASMTARIAAYETFTNKSLKGEGSPLVATASGDIAATGHPLVMYVIVPRNDGGSGLMLTRGAVYSYFENNVSADDWKRMVTTAGGEISAPSWSSSYLSDNGSFAQDAKRFRSIEGVMPSAIAAAPTVAERRRQLSAVELDLESNVVRRADGELWYTVRAPQMNGSEIQVAVVDNGGTVVYRGTAGRIEGGKRFDLVRVDGLSAGQYFIRVSDITNRVLASGRFMVVR
jgi:hypothetical protein